jgi:hypothetical protein
MFDRELANALASSDPLGLVEHLGRAAAGAEDDSAGLDRAQRLPADAGGVAGQARSTIGSTGRDTGAQAHDGLHGAGEVLAPAQAALTAHAMKRATAPGSIQEPTTNGR